VSDAHRRAWEDRHRDATAIAPPSPFIVAAVDLIARRAAAANPSVRGRTTTRPRALDVACGGGRHALLLASRGYAVVAADFARSALLALRARAATVQLAGTVDVVAADATRWPFGAATFDVIVVVDFLDRALLPTLRDAVAPGGALVIETFMLGQERYGHPRNPDYLLRAGELRETCRGWTIVLAHEGESTTPSPSYRAGIAAVRPPFP